MEWIESGVDALMQSSSERGEGRREQMVASMEGRREQTEIVIRETVWHPPSVSATAASIRAADDVPSVHDDHDEKSRRHSVMAV